MSVTNVALRLTEDPEILATLRKNNALRARTVDPKNPRKLIGTETYVVLHDARSFEFEPGKTLVVPDDVARGLYAQGVLHGGTPTELWGGLLKFDSALDADYVPVLEVVEKWEMGQEQPSVRATSRTTCPLCKTDKGSVDALKLHILECSEDAEAVASQKAKSA